MPDKQKNILLIEDDLTFSKIIYNFLVNRDFSVDLYHQIKEGIKAFNKNSYDLVITDLRLPDGLGVDILTHIKSSKPEIPVILMTIYTDIRTAVEAMKSGAFEYIIKPINSDELLFSIEQALQKKDAETDKSKDTDPSDKVRPKINLDYVQGMSKTSMEVQEQVALVAPTDMSVIVLGESGTGKEYVSRMIHHLSKRSEGPFVAVDCGAISKELAGSELFGHVKGAFTGALQDKIGQFEAANGGTIFLDEIGNLSYEVQVQLLRVIQERKVRRLGSNQDTDIDVRIIAATNDDLKDSVRNGYFREDLYHRINEFSIKISPLRERKADIMQLAAYFLQKSNQELHKEILDFEEEVVQVFQKYPWPGNLRELKNIVKRAVLLTQGSHITLTCLPPELMEEQSSDANREEAIDSGNNLKAMQAKTEKEIIIQTLQEVNFNKSKAAKLLNIDRKTLYNKMKRYNIEL